MCGMQRVLNRPTLGTLIPFLSSLKILVKADAVFIHIARLPENLRKVEPSNLSRRFVSCVIKELSQNKMIKS
jgi:hypothetical protein